MIVTSVASPHHRSMLSAPSVTARLKPKATLIASAISVIMPGMMVAQLPNSPLQERPAAVAVDRAAEQGGEVGGAGEDRRAVAEPVLDHLRPEHGRNRQRERDPEAIAEHRHAVAGMPVVRAVIRRMM